MTPESRAFAAFLASLEARETREWGDDVDLGALIQLRGAERERAEQLLLDSLAGDRPDSRAARALVELRSGRAVEPLRRALAMYDDSRVVTIAEALAALDPTFDPVGHYLAALRASQWSCRSLAAVALGGRHEAAVIDALLVAVADDDSYVRAAAHGALITSLGLGSVHKPPFSPLREMGQRLICGLPSVWREAAADTRRIVEAIQSGRSPKALGLTETASAWLSQMERFLAVHHDRADPDRDYEDLESFPTAGRRMVEAILLYQLERDHPRVPRALARIGTPRSVGALEDALRLPLKRAATEAEEALRVLRARHAGGG